MQAPTRISDCSSPDVRREEPAVAKFTEENRPALCFRWDDNGLLAITQHNENAIRGPQAFVFEAYARNVGPAKCLVPSRLERFQNAHLDFIVVVLDGQKFIKRAAFTRLPPFP